MEQGVLRPVVYTVLGQVTPVTTSMDTVITVVRLAIGETSVIEVRSSERVV